MIPNPRKILGVLVLAAAGIAVTGGCVPVFADTIHLKRGGTLEGTVVDRGATVEVRMDGGSTTFTKEEIDHIEKKGGASAAKPGSAADTVSRWKDNAAKAARRVGYKASAALDNAKKTTAGWMKPIQRSEGARAQEKMVNDNLMELQNALKKTHDREKSIAEEKRKLKADGFSI